MNKENFLEEFILMYNKNHCNHCPFSSNKTLFIKIHDYYKRINIEDILWIEAAGSYSTLWMKTNTKVTVSKNLTQIALELPKKNFVRIHRSSLVNIEYVDTYHGNILKIGNTELNISKAHKKTLMEHFYLLS